MCFFLALSPRRLLTIDKWSGAPGFGLCAFKFTLLICFHTSSSTFVITMFCKLLNLNKSTSPTLELSSRISSEPLADIGYCVI